MIKKRIIAVPLLIIMFAMIFISSNELNKREIYLMTQIFPSLKSINKINNIINEQRRYELILINQNGGTEGVLKELNRIGINVLDEFSVYESYDASAEDKAYFADLKHKLKIYNQLMKAVVNPIDPSNDDNYHLSLVLYP